MGIKKQGFLQALGIVAYCFLIGVFFWNANTVFGETDTFLSPIVFLLLFSTSVLICTVIVFLKPYRLFTEGKNKEALEVVISTAIFLLVLLALLFVISFLLK